MKSEPTKKERIGRIKMEVPKEAVRCTFLNAIQEVESLKEFYRTFRDSWIKNKCDFEQDYAMGLALNNIIKELSNSKDAEADYVKIKENEIAGQKVDDIIALHFTKVEQQTKISYSMKPGFSKQDPQKSRDEDYKFAGQREIFVRSILSNIVIIFESYFSQIYEFVVVLNPESYFEGKTIKIKELFCMSINQIVSNEIYKQVSSNMYDSMQTLKTMGEKSNFDINRYIPIQEEFEEIYYRRNIFVHNSGNVNDVYLNSVADKYKTKLKCNDQLSCDDTYIENAIIVLKKIICSLFFEFLLVTNSEKDCYTPLSEDVAFTALCNGEYSVAEYIYGILRRHKGFDFADKTMFEINYMISVKQQKRSIEKLLEKFDESAMQEQFVIAKNCLQDNHEEVYLLLSQIYPNYMPAEAIRDWPLFIDFRKSEMYNKFQAEHVEDFKQHTFEADGLKAACEAADITCGEESPCI